MMRIGIASGRGRLELKVRDRTQLGDTAYFGVTTKTNSLLGILF